MRIAFHVLQATGYYPKDMRPFVFASGKSVDDQCWVVGEEDLPSRDDLLICIEKSKAKTEKWLSEMDFDAENKSFNPSFYNWTGLFMRPVLLFPLAQDT